MSENFAELLEESFSGHQLKKDQVIKGEVISVDSDFVVINAGLKSEGFVPIEQFYDEAGDLEIAVGDIVEVALDDIEDGLDTLDEILEEVGEKRAKQAGGGIAYLLGE